MSHSDAFLIRVGPGILSGITLGRWLKVLRENRFSVDLPYWGRAATITSGSIQNSLCAWWESRLYGELARGAKVDAPLFIIGTWRSGTTYLHNLFAQDDRFAYANNYQVSFPLTFLTMEKSHSKFIGRFMPKRRPQDNVMMGVREPQEDEFAFCSMTGRSVAMGWAFPRRTRDQYNRYLTFRDASSAEVAEWKAALTELVQKLSFKYGKPLVLKSPAHTCRIKLLLELFPNARFVHIHRNPYRVFQSTIHLMRAISPWITLQRPDFDDLEARTIEQYKEVYDAFFLERDLIPIGQYHEVGFEDLEADPIGEMRRIYEGLSLADFGHAEVVLKRYILSLEGYKKNVFPELRVELREQIAREWRPCFDAWGYCV
jgi:omega-hydroxy-beta-dihydromenaquinone-9 sulfotransferase